MLKKDLFQWVIDLSFQFKNGILVTWLGTEPTVSIRKPHQIEVILKSQTLTRKSNIYEFFAYWLGNGLLTSSGDVWHRNRRLMTPAFHFSMLDQFSEIITEKVELFNNCIKMEVDKNPEAPINIFPMAIKFTLDTTCKPVMGVDMAYNPQKADNDNIGKRKPKVFLDRLMDLSEADENPLSLEEIREQVDTFMFGGHDTTGITISWVLFSLGNAPEVQRKVHEELDNVIGIGNQPATKEQLSQLKYLDRVIKETLRIYPSAPMVGRILDHNTVIDGHIIPKGVVVNLQILHLHRDPEIWDAPDKFNPDRFLPESSNGRHPYAYVPFSAGPRNCIGQKFAGLVLKIALTAIMIKWEVKSALKPSEIKLNSQIVLTPVNRNLGIYFKPSNQIITINS
ncbi:cytochrome P450 4V2 [Nasonia vitripennis]|uniref:Cytochrome P450 n=1 Tax=Nasonia vitripennis TaxID=7425 RepID=A0A7M7QD62_NASVI|nr:cytochrome P450 4V2 [Nasonia vitripennis]